MRLHQLIPAFLLPAALFASRSDAAIIAFSQQALWDQFTSNNGATLAVESFDAYVGAAAPSLSGPAAGVQWLAAAAGGVRVGTAAGSPALSTTDSAPLVLTFSGTGVRGIGTNVFGTDSGSGIVPLVVRVTLSDGTSIVRTMSSTASFLGVWSTGPDITSILFVPESSASPGALAFATVDNLTFAVIPAPASGIAFAAAAALAPRSRRR